MFNIFQNLVKQRLQDHFIQAWNSRLEGSSKSKFVYIHKFVSISTLFKLCKNEKKYRNALSRVICSSHRLEIESGRWHRPVRKPVDERKCKNCNVVENEFHFLF